MLRNALGHQCYTQSVLTADEQATVKLLIDLIVPADDFPSASAAGVLEYISHQLAESTSELGAYQLALPSLTTIKQLSTHQQLELFRSRESEPFIQLLIRHTIEGYYAMPESNSWKMIGFEVTA